MAEKSSGEGAGADAVVDMLQKIQVNSEERDMAIRLLKTGGLEAASVKVQPAVLAIEVIFKVFSFIHGFHCLCHAWKLFVFSESHFSTIITLLRIFSNQLSVMNFPTLVKSHFTQSTAKEGTLSGQIFGVFQ